MKCYKKISCFSFTIFLLTIIALLQHYLLPVDLALMKKYDSPLYNYENSISMARIISPIALFLSIVFYLLDDPENNKQ